MKTTYTPQQDSVAWKVIEFLTTHPDEELTKEDVATKYDRPAGNVHSLLSAAVEAGILQRCTSSDDELVYRLGSGLASVKANRSRHPSLRPDVLLSGGNLGSKRRATPVIDLANIVLSSDMPMPRTGLKTDWSVLFDRMKVNQSCVLPVQMKATLGKAITEAKNAGKGEFVIRRISDDEIGLWRVK